jgi:hypothetical protein
MNSRELQTIRGDVQALSAVPGREEVVRVIVVSDDGTQYHILQKWAGTGLLANINASVEITGHVSPLSSVRPVAGTGEEPESGAPECLLNVKHFRLIDGFDDPWYDDAVR